MWSFTGTRRHLLVTWTKFLRFKNGIQPYHDNWNSNLQQYSCSFSSMIQNYILVPNLKLRTWFTGFRQLKKETKYFIENLSCGISLTKVDNSIEIVRPPQADEVGGIVPPNSMHEASSYPKTSKLSTKIYITSFPKYAKKWQEKLKLTGEAGEQWRNAFIHPSCSLCMNRRPHTGLSKKFTYAELQIATNGFSKQNLMHDQGRKTYFGLLSDQRKTMIRENPSVTIKDEDFKREAKILEGVRHENVAVLVGSCLEGPHMYLVYEYVCDGSLNKHLSEKSKKLTWERRISIAYGAAKGLEYLHGERIYGSMRPSNILITHDYQPLVRLNIDIFSFIQMIISLMTINMWLIIHQLSYYGLTVNRYEALGQSSESTVLKTFEYLAPEYEETGIDLSKADVYSFGVVLLELITGRKTIQHTEGQSFLRWVNLFGKNYFIRKITQLK